MFVLNYWNVNVKLANSTIVSCFQTKDAGKNAKLKLSILFNEPLKPMLVINTPRISHSVLLNAHVSANVN